MRGGYRTKVFVATVSVAAGAVLLASLLAAVSLRRQTYDRIARDLTSEARLAAELLSRGAPAASGADLQDEARTLARDIDARVTLIAVDGRVVGDSSQDAAGLAQLENHGTRPEVVDARQHGIGTSTRFSATLGIDMLYVAATVRHPSIATVRLALPLTEIERQLRTIWRAALYALAVAIAGAFAMAWIASSLLVRRLDRLAAGARRYAAGDLPSPPVDHEDDEIGALARVLDDAVRQLRDRAADLARGRARTEAIVGGMVEGVLVVDADGRVQLVNAAARRMLRIDGEAIGRHYLECVRHPGIVSQLDRVGHGGRDRDAEPPVVHEGGRVFVARAAPVADVGGRGAVLVLHDITDLQRMDQIRRDFVANVSHELRTPLTAIGGYVEALLDQRAGRPDDRRFLEIIARHTKRMERLAADLLRLAQLESDQQPPEYAPCSLDDVCAGVAADLQLKLERKQQRLGWTIDRDVAAVSGDAAQLHDVLRNLVENAIAYSPPATAIAIRARADGPRLVITVADEGPGIPAADLSRVFERFYRVDKARSHESGGTGLGLAIVKHIVERMDGSVRAENRSGGSGAIFTIDLPLRRVEQTVGS